MGILIDKYYRNTKDGNFFGQKEMPRLHFLQIAVNRRPKRLFSKVKYNLPKT